MTDTPQSLQRPNLPGRFSPAWLRRVRFAYEMAAPRRTLFVMSHMRSYSTLLCHILNSNPAIDGYVEMHKPYTKELDLLELALRVRSTTGRGLKGKYVVDKVLHNYELSTQILRRKDVYGIFFIRDPQQSVRSIIAMGLRRQTPDWKSQPDKVVGHYVRRMQRLSQQGKIIGKRALFFEAELLVEDTDRVLAALTSFLELGRPLTPQYETSPMTGTARFGDASPFIKTGEIVRERDDYARIDVPARLMFKAQRAYDDCREKLARFSGITVASSTPAAAAPSAPARRAEV